MKKCKYCGTPIKDTHYRVICKSHECYKASRRDYYQKNKDKWNTGSCHSPAKYAADKEEVAKELKGLLPIHGKGGLFEGCSEDKIRAMKSGDFKEFMR